jgi:hypothetical protein
MFDVHGSRTYDDTKARMLRTATRLGAAVRPIAFSERDLPTGRDEEQRRGEGAGNSTAVTADGDDLVEVLDLQAVVQRVAEAMRGME